MFQKIFNCIGQLGLLRLSPSKARTKSRERLLRMILFYSGYLQNKRERQDMERKHMNSGKTRRKEPELTT